MINYCLTTCLCGKSAIGLAGLWKIDRLNFAKTQFFLENGVETRGSRKVRYVRKNVGVLGKTENDVSLLFTGFPAVHIYYEFSEVFPTTDQKISS